MKTNKFAHTPNTKYGMGDYYGSGVKNPMGREVDSYMKSTIKPGKMKRPPKSLA
jgi:hypothetical protein